MLRRSKHLKSRSEVDAMREPNRLVAECLVKVKQAVKPGVTTGEIDDLVVDFFTPLGATSLFKGYPGKVPFPAATCISVNDEVVHGIPGKRVLQEGDIVSIDTGWNYKGWCGDSAISIAVGPITPEKQRLIKCAEDTLALAIKECSRQKKWSQVALKMQDFVHAHGYSVVEQFVGHGIGRTMHEDPQVPNFVSKSWMRHDFWLDEGLVIAIEPMVNMGTKRVLVKDDHWTVVTKDGLPSVHVEHTIAITAKGVEILTSRDGLE